MKVGTKEWQERDRRLAAGVVWSLRLIDAPPGRMYVRAMMPDETVARPSVDLVTAVARRYLAKTVLASAVSPGVYEITKPSRRR